MSVEGNKRVGIRYTQNEREGSGKLRNCCERERTRSKLDDDGSASRSRGLERERGAVIATIRAEMSAKKGRRNEALIVNSVVWIVIPAIVERKVAFMWWNRRMGGAK